MDSRMWYVPWRMARATLSRMARSSALYCWRCRTCRSASVLLATRNTGTAAAASSRHLSRCACNICCSFAFWRSHSATTWARIAAEGFLEWRRLSRRGGDLNDAIPNESLGAGRCVGVGPDAPRGVKEDRKVRFLMPRLRVDPPSIGSRGIVS